MSSDGSSLDMIGTQQFAPKNEKGSDPGVRPLAAKSRPLFTAHFGATTGTDPGTT